MRINADQNNYAPDLSQPMNPGHIYLDNGLPPDSGEHKVFVYNIMDKRLSGSQITDRFWQLKRM
jgi:hypothetical protein